MSEQSKAPDVIWANTYWKDSGLTFLGQIEHRNWDYANSFGRHGVTTEYVSRDHCNALVGAETERCANHVWKSRWGTKTECDYLRTTIKQIILEGSPADAQAAYDAAISAARAEALTEAMALFEKDETLPGCVVLHRLEKLRGKSDG